MATLELASSQLLEIEELTAMRSTRRRASGFVQLLLAPVGLVFCWIRAQRQPWLSLHCTAGAGCGNLIRARRSDAAAGEATAVGQTPADNMSKTPPRDFDLDEFSLGLGAETDRACGVLGAALLDGKLEAVFARRLRAFGKELLGRMGPLQSFGARIRMARALSWVNDDAQCDLDTIRDIRNDFAHNWDHTLAFSTQSITDRCSNLRSANAFIKGFDVAAIVPGRSLSSSVFKSMQTSFMTPRWRYQLAVTFLAQYLDDIPSDDSSYAGADLIAEIQAVSANSQFRISASGTVGVPSSSQEE